MASTLLERPVPLGRPRTVNTRPTYTTNDVERVIDGYVYDENQGQTVPAGHSNPADDGCWLQHRARLEARGDVDSVEFTLMLDVERAVGKLQEAHPIAAAVLALSMMGWTPGEIEQTFAKMRTPAARHFDKGIAYCRAYLSGEDAEAAFMAAHRR